ncbi:MAG: SDR family NAD(P)-dependent oxidoreductase [Nevskiaceae bacterium]
MTTPLLPDFRLDGKVALITGASSGIGARLAEGFAAAGATVVLAARREDRLQALAARLQSHGARAVPVALDVTDPAAIAQTFDRIAANIGIVDVLVNNAGIAEPHLYLKTTAESRDATFATNFTSAWDMSAEAAKRLIAAGRPGSIINITSVLGIGVGVGYSAYAASKAALAQLTRSMALEFVRHRIRVNALAPGWFVTEMNEQFFATAEGQDYLKKMPPGRAGQLDELVGPALLLASEAGSFVNGVVLPVDGAHHVALV